MTHCLLNRHYKETSKILVTKIRENKATTVNVARLKNRKRNKT